MERTEIEKEFARLKGAFRNESDPNGKESFGIGFWKGVSILEAENKELKIILELTTHNYGESIKIQFDLDKENKELKEKLEDVGYLRDYLRDKKSEVTSTKSIVNDLTKALRE